MSCPLSVLPYCPTPPPAVLPYRCTALYCSQVVSKKARTVLSTEQLLQLLPDGTRAHTAAPAAAQAQAAAPAQDAAAHMQQPAAESHPATWTKQQHSTQQQQPVAAGIQSTGPTQVKSSQSLEQHQQQPQQHQQPTTANGGCSALASSNCNNGSSSNGSSEGAACGLTGGPVPPAAVTAHVQELVGPLYSLVGVDLRHIDQVTAALQRAGFDNT